MAKRIDRNLAITAAVLAVLSIAVSGYSLFQSERAIRLAEWQAAQEQWVPQQFAFDGTCEAKIVNWPDGAVLMSLEVFAQRGQRTLSLLQMTDSLNFNTYALFHLRDKYGQMALSYEGYETQVEARRATGEGGEYGDTFTEYRSPTDHIFLVVTDVEMRGEMQRYYSAYDLVLYEGFAVWQEGRSESPSFYVCGAFTLLERFQDEDSAWDWIANSRNEIAARSAPSARSRTVEEAK